MKLQQGQVWNTGDQFIRIVGLERLAVTYKVMKNIQTREGTHHTTTKKEFCKLIKHAILLAPSETRGLTEEAQPEPSAAPAPLAPDSETPPVQGLGET